MERSERETQSRYAKLKTRERFRDFRTLIQGNSTVFMLSSVLVLLAVFMPRFFNPYNVSTMLGSQDLICIGLMAIGATFVISTGGIDLSLAGVCVASSIVAALLAPYGAWLSLFGAIGFGILIGAINGALVAWGRLPSFIVTLAMLMALRGLSLIMADRGRVPVDRDFGLVVFQNTKLGIVPLVFIVFAAIGIVSWFVYTRTRFGLHVLAVGGDEQASLMMGLRVPLVHFFVFSISGGLSGLAGVFLLAKTTTGNPLEAQGWELTAIAAVILGGTLLTGGKGTITGTLSGVALLALVFQVLNYVNGMGIEINTYLQNVIRGLFVLAVVVVQARAVLGSKKRRT
ncbi:ABC transporter permease [Populibacterium corticicola]|uniref:ABC transporter permease n=1 Tax=Populibacterium corticicola TaxID=1812826 RepID=A0ABW5XFW1_9MICO